MSELSISTGEQTGGASDLNHGVAEEAKKGPRQILESEIREGLVALQRSAGGLFLSALSAGLDVGFSLFLMAIMLTRGKDVLPTPVVEMLAANMYAVGFIFVVVGRSELFTEQTTLAVLPTLRGKASVLGLLRLWVIVYVANLLGAAGSAAMIVYIGPALGVIEPWAFGTFAHRLVELSWTSILCSGLLAGWLMGLLSWLVAAGRDTISQIVLVWLITTVIGFAHLHHVVLGSVEVLAGVFAGQGVSAGDFGRFLLWTTLGNAAGGVIFVALIKYGHAQSLPQQPAGSGAAVG